LLKATAAAAEHCLGLGGGGLEILTFFSHRRRRRLDFFRKHQRRRRLTPLIVYDGDSFLFVLFILREKLPSQHTEGGEKKSNAKNVIHFFLPFFYYFTIYISW
jgi:hypothetical protein